MVSKNTFTRNKNILPAIFVIIISIFLLQCTNKDVAETDGRVSIFPKPGNFTEPFDVRIETDLKDVILRYTTDGSSPDNNSEVYKNKIRIEQSTIIQAAAFNQNGELVDGVGTVFLITPGNGKPTGVLQYIDLLDGKTRYEVTANEPENDPLTYRWYVDGRLQPGETDSIFISDLRTESERTVNVAVRINDGTNTVEIKTKNLIAALPLELEQGLVDLLLDKQNSGGAEQNSPPEFKLQAPYDMLEYGESMRLTAYAEDPDGDEIEYLWIINDEVIQQGQISYFDFMEKPDKGQSFIIKVAVSDKHSVKSAQANIFVNEKQPLARFKKVSGKVEVQTASGEWLSVKTRMALDLSDTIATGFGASALIELGDSIITVEPMSRITLDALSSKGGVQETSLFMRMGSVAASVDASEGAHDFEVLGPHATASVRGTEFSFDGLNLKVFKGKVALKMGPPNRNIQLNNQRARKKLDAAGESEDETSSDTADDTSDDGSSSDEDSESSEDSEAGADEAGDEVLVGSGESAEVSLTASGGEAVVVKDSDLSIDQFSNIQEVSLPTHSLVNIELKFQEVDTSSSIEDNSQLIMTEEH